MWRRKDLTTIETVKAIGIRASFATKGTYAFVSG